MGKVSHWLETPLTDKVLGDETGTFVTPLLAKDLVYANLGVWWMEPDRNGELYLCRYAPESAMAYIDCEDSQQNTYTSLAVDFVGGRPHVTRPIHK